MDLTLSLACDQAHSWSPPMTPSTKQILSTGTGAAAGSAGAISAVAAAGLPGLSAAGITSGLAAVGGTMLGGVVVVAAAPLAGAVLAYGLARWLWND